MSRSRLGALAWAICAFGALAIAGGCATSRVVYERDGVSPEERDRDEQACLRSAMNVADARGVVANVQFDRDVYAHCMESRGYTVKSQ